MDNRRLLFQISAHDIHINNKRNIYRQYKSLKHMNNQMQYSSTSSVNNIGTKKLDKIHVICKCIPIQLTFINKQLRPKNQEQPYLL